MKHFILKIIKYEFLHVFEKNIVLSRARNELNIDENGLRGTSIYEKIIFKIYFFRKKR